MIKVQCPKCSNEQNINDYSFKCVNCNYTTNFPVKKVIDKREWQSLMGRCITQPDKEDYVILNPVKEIYIDDEGKLSRTPVYMFEKEAKEIHRTINKKKDYVVKEGRTTENSLLDQYIVCKCDKSDGSGTWVYSDKKMVEHKRPIYMKLHEAAALIEELEF